MAGISICEHVVLLLQMKGWQDRKWSWDMQGLSLHIYTVVNWEKKFASV